MIIDGHAFHYAYSIAGFIVGMLVGFTGVGGGSLMTPLLVLLFGFSPVSAVGTDLLYAAVTKTSGTLVHSFNRTVDWRVVGRLATGSLPATVLTLIGLKYFGVSGHLTNSIISTVLGLALILTAITLLFRRWILAHLAAVISELSEREINRATVGLGFVLGFFVTLSSVGAGAIGATVLILLYPRFPMARIVGSDIAHAVPLTLIAGLGHWYLGSINIGLLFSLLIGSVPGIMIGSQLAAYLPDRMLRTVLAGTLAIVGFRLAL